MNKRNKEQKRKSVQIVKKKPYTIKQENDMVLGKTIMWSFLISFPMTVILGFVMSWKIKVCLLLLGILSLLFAVYNLLGVIFKWNHARVCTKNYLKKAYKFGIRNAWTKEDTKDSISVVAIWGIFGVILLVGLFFY